MFAATIREKSSTGLRSKFGFAERCDEKNLRFVSSFIKENM